FARSFFGVAYAAPGGAPFLQHKGTCYGEGGKEETSSKEGSGQEGAGQEGGSRKEGSGQESEAETEPGADEAHESERRSRGSSRCEGAAPWSDHEESLGLHQE